MSTNSESSSAKIPLEVAMKIVEHLDGVPKDVQGLALKFAMETLKLSLPTGQALVPQAPAHSPQTAIQTSQVAPVQCANIKSFATAKAPKSDQQFAAVVAYYYQFVAPPGPWTDAINAMTMKEAARLAARKQVNNWRVTLENARRSGYLDKVGPAMFKLNAVGENLVAITLPGNAAPGNGGGSVKTPAKKKKSKVKKA